jgi:hypothetical protein
MNTVENREKKKKKIWEGSSDGFDVLVEATDQRGKCHSQIKGHGKDSEPESSHPLSRT